MKNKQTPMYWQNGSYGSAIDHKTDRDLDPWIRKEYIKHHSQKSGAFSVEERLGKDAQKVKASSDGDQ